MKFGDKDFHSLNYFFRNRFGEKIIKISIDAGFTCPNRDGKVGVGGCNFCSERGSGEFTQGQFSIKRQIEEYKEFIRPKWRNGKYIAYFQAYTNTYDTVENLKQKYYEALEQEDIIGISIATRPDCLEDDVLELLAEISNKTFLMVELGLQTSNEKTAMGFNRCYNNDVYIKAVLDLKRLGANVVTHVILGLPGDSKEDIFNTVKYAINAGTDGIKLHLLYIVNNTVMAKLYETGTVPIMDFDTYITLLADLIEIIPSEIVIHRLTGDAKREELIAPMYSIKKFEILNAVDNELKRRGSFQGIKQHKKVL